MPYQYKGRKKWFRKHEVFMILASPEKTVHLAQKLGCERSCIRKIRYGLTFKKWFDEFNQLKEISNGL